MKTAEISNKKFFPQMFMVIKNIMLSYIITLVLLAILALVITYTPVSTAVVPPVVVLITVLSVFLTGFIVAKRNSANGWSAGAVTGFLYIVILYLISHCIFTDISLSSSFFMMLGICILSGTVGGIVGVNVN